MMRVQMPMQIVRRTATGAARAALSVASLAARCSVPFPASRAQRSLTTTAFHAAAPPKSETSAAAPSSSSSSASSSSSSSNVVVELTMDNVREVLSRPVPILLDCYADWCEPCKTLTPKLTALVQARRGRLILAKLNVDTCGELISAMQLPVQSIPAVFALHRGRFLASFVGMKRDAELEAWVDKVMRDSAAAAGADGSTTESIVDATGEEQHVTDAERDAAIDASADVEEVLGAAMQALNERKDLVRASHLFSHVLNNRAQSAEWKKPNARVRATIGLVQCLLSQHEQQQQNEQQQENDNADYTALDSANVLVSTLQQEAKASRELQAELQHADVVKVLSALSMQQQLRAVGSDNIDSLRKAVEVNPKDAKARHDLAVLLFHQGLLESAVHEALALLRIHRDDGKQLLLQFFEQLGPTHALTLSARKRMAAYLL